MRAAAGGADGLPVRDPAAFELCHRIALASAQRGELSIALPAALDVALLGGADGSPKPPDLVVAVSFELAGPTTGAHFRPGPCGAHPERAAHMFAYSRADGASIFADGARTWFPCYDAVTQPRVPASSFEVHITVAADLMAIGPGVLVTQRDVPAGTAAEGLGSKPL